MADETRDPVEQQILHALGIPIHRARLARVANIIREANADQTAELESCRRYRDLWLAIADAMKASVA